MPLVSRSIPNLFQGISQQPASLRLTSQAEAQINAYATIARGNEKRPPTQHIAKVSNSTVGAAYVHTINRDLTERYIVVITNGDLKVYDLAGVEKTVSFPDGKTYLNATTPRTSFAAVTVVDYTFIVNKTKTVAMGTTIASGTFKGSKQSFSDLPTTGNTAGDVWEIAGDPASVVDDYYVKYGADGMWRECAKPAASEYINLDATTMPHQLVRNGDGTFTFQKATWVDRAAGDIDSAAYPSIVGKKLSDIFFHRDRLGVVGSENLVTSRTGEYFTFWPETVTAVLDTDPIDAAASHIKASTLNFAVPYNKTLMLFSDQTQFVLSGDPTLTPKTASLDVSTEFESSKNVHPTTAGPNMFFVLERGDYAGMREYYIDDTTVSNDAADITAHVPNYIPAGVFRLAVSSNEDVLFLLTSGAVRRVYVYKYYWVGDDKAQSCWSYWEFASTDTVLNIDVIQNVLYLLIERSDGVYLEKIELGVDASEAAVGYPVLIDRRTTLTGVYDSGTDKTTWTLPYADSGDIQVVLGSAFGNLKGKLLGGTTRPTSSSIAVAGDYSAGTAYVGRKYTFEYEFSEQFVREESDGSERSIIDGRLQLRTFSVRYEQTGYFEARVKPEGRDEAIYKFTGKTLGSTVLGAASLESGTFKFPVGTRSTGVRIRLMNDSPMPCRFMSADWEGTFVLRSKRM